MATAVATPVQTLKEGFVTKDPVSGFFGGKRRRWLSLRIESGANTVYRLQWSWNGKVRGDLLVTRDTKVTQKAYDVVEISTYGRKLVLRPTTNKDDKCDAAALMAWKDAVEAIQLQLEAAGPSAPSGAMSSSAVRP